MRSEARIAFVTDALPVIGGAEKTLFAALECFPRADVFTLIYNKQGFVNTPLESRQIFISYLDKFPLAGKYYRWLLPLMPGAMEQFDLNSYDVVVSFNYAVANGANAGHAKHFSYTHTPMRYAWGDPGSHAGRLRSNFFLNQYFRSFRRWDRIAAAHILSFAAISNGIAGQIRAAYHREARVIYPPVEIDRFQPCPQRERYYVVLSRLVAHKRLDLIIKAFSKLRLPLKVIGAGPQEIKLRKLAAGNVEFLGFQSDERVANLLGRARGLISAAEEDFGIAMVEAQAAGCPVIALGKGGALETVIDNTTGILFEEPTLDSLIHAVERFEVQVPDFNTSDILNNARRFARDRFVREFKSFIGAPEDRGSRVPIQWTQDTLRTNALT